MVQTHHVSIQLVRPEGFLSLLVLDPKQGFGGYRAEYQMNFGLMEFDGLLSEDAAAVNLFGSGVAHRQRGPFGVVVIGREAPHHVLNVTHVAGDADDLQLVPQQTAAASDKLPAFLVLFRAGSHAPNENFLALDGALDLLDAGYFVQRTESASDFPCR